MRKPAETEETEEISVLDPLFSPVDTVHITIYCTRTSILLVEFLDLLSLFNSLLVLGALVLVLGTIGL